MSAPAKGPPIWIVVVVLAVAAACLALYRLDGLDQLAGPATLPWPLLLVAFAAAEVFVVHLHFRSESSTFSFIEVPLILGGLFTAPLLVWASMTLGAAFAMLVVRRQPPIKAAFNTANLSLQAATALTLLHLLAGTDDLLGPRTWVAAFVAALASGLLNAVAFIVVITMIERGFDLQGVRQTVAMNSLTSVTNVSVALIAASLIDYRPETLLLLGVPLIVLFAAYRAFVDERAQRERVQFMFESATEISAMRDRNDIPEMLERTAARLRAGRAHVFLFEDARPGTRAVLFSFDGHTSDIVDVGGVQLARALEATRVFPEPTLVPDALTGALTGLLPDGHHPCLVGTISADSGVLGLMTIGERLGDIAHFTAGDLALFATVIEQLGLALENDHLGNTVSELERLGRALSHEANHDPLTGLANRALMARILERALDARERVTLLYIDVDDFKTINDGLGHDAGDRVLIEIGRRLRSVVSKSDCVARLGGDEFAIVLENPVDAVSTAERVLRAVNAPVEVGQHGVGVGASVGVAHSRPGQSAAELLKNADGAMYIAKGRGKGSLAIDETPDDPDRAVGERPGHPTAVTTQP